MGIHSAHPPHAVVEFRKAASLDVDRSCFYCIQERCRRFSPQQKPSSRYSLHTTYYRKRGSASYIVREVLLVRERERERYREREIDGSDVTIVPLKLAMNLHFPLPKIRTIGDELTLSLAKNSHFSFLPSHFPSLPSRRGHHGGAEIRNEFTLSIAKTFFALRLCCPSFKKHEPRDE